MLMGCPDAGDARPPTCAAHRRRSRTFLMGLIANRQWTFRESRDRSLGLAQREPDRRLLSSHRLPFSHCPSVWIPLLCLYYNGERCIWSEFSAKKIFKTKLSSWNIKAVSTNKAGQFNNLSSLDQGIGQNPLDRISDHRIWIILADVA